MRRGQTPLTATILKPWTLGFHYLIACLVGRQIGRADGGATRSIEDVEKISRLCTFDCVSSYAMVHLMTLHRSLIVVFVKNLLAIYQLEFIELLLVRAVVLVSSWTSNDAAASAEIRAWTTAVG